MGINKEPKLYPGRQKKIFSLSIFNSLLYGLIGLFFIFAFFAFLKGNRELLGLPKSSLWNLKLLSGSMSVKILVLLLGLLLTKWSLELGFRPILIYSGNVVKNPNKPFINDNINSNDLFWSVTVQNVGSGIALIRRVKYRCSKSNADIPQYKEAAFELRRKLDEIGFKDKRDYALSTISTGFALPCKGEIHLFEIPLKNLSKIKLLDIQLEFEGLLGQKYRKEIFCIPRENKPTNETIIMT